MCVHVWEICTNFGFGDLGNGCVAHSSLYIVGKSVDVYMFRDKIIVERFNPHSISSHAFSSYHGMQQLRHHLPEVVI